MTSVAARDPLGSSELSWEFLKSEFAQDNYGNWPIERRLDAYLRHHELLEVLNDGVVYRSLLDCVMANIGSANRRGVLGHGASEANHATNSCPEDDWRMTDVTETMVEDRVLEDAVMLACRAPSLHNSQPWRWVSDGAVLHLFADHMRMMLTADSSGRELLLSCGAVLDHLRVAMAAAGWDTAIEHFPDPHEPDHLAALSFTPTDVVTDAQHRRADAILLRRTDRLPFDAPDGWADIETRLRLAVIPHHVMADVVLERDRPALAQASRLTETLRASDPSYQNELDCWTSPFASHDSVPQSALASASEISRTDVARTFPSAARSDRRIDIGADRSQIIVLSTHHEDARLDVLRCGEALSAVLLEATLAGLATCTLTHMTEVMPSRDIIRQLTGQIGSPQLLIRIGLAPSNAQPLPVTPRRPLAEVLAVRR
jgi:hypothetical protein